MMQFAKAVLPRPVRVPVGRAADFAYAKATQSWRFRAFACDIRDALDWVFGESDPVVPPRKLIYGIGGSLHIGERFVGHFRQIAGLRPDEAVLDVGCGIGRMALPLAKYLTAGRYEGFDIVRANAAWCRKAITPRYPRFRFQHADIFNREYNPRGRVRGDEYRFPYPDESFDFAYLTSVFTHLLPNEVAHYLTELGRVLRPGGRCFATAFLLNEESNHLLETGRSRVTLEPPEGVYRVHSRVVPEACVALDEDWFESAAQSAGLRIERPAHYGLWCGRETWTDDQDIVILRK